MQVTVALPYPCAEASDNEFPLRRELSGHKDLQKAVLTWLAGQPAQRKMDSSSFHLTLSLKTGPAHKASWLPSSGGLDPLL